MKKINQIVAEWRKKTEDYDKDGGFIVYVEGEDNRDFDVDLMERFLRKELEARDGEMGEEIYDEVKEKALWAIRTDGQGVDSSATEEQKIAFKAGMSYMLRIVLRKIDRQRFMNQDLSLLHPHEEKGCCCGDPTDKDVIHLKDSPCYYPNHTKDLIE